MTNGELIAKLQKHPLDVTVIVGGTDYPEPVSSVTKVTKKNFDGYVYPEIGSNKDAVLRLL